MNVDVLFAGVPVSDFKAAQAWYERFFARPADVVAYEFARPADVVAYEDEVMWQVAGRGWLYIIRDPDHTGNSIVATAVPDIEAAVSVLAARGVTTGAIGPAGRCRPAGRRAGSRRHDRNHRGHERWVKHLSVCAHS